LISFANKSITFYGAAYFAAGAREERHKKLTLNGAIRFRSTLNDFVLATVTLYYFAVLGREDHQSEDQLACHFQRRTWQTTIRS
jgi:hypothetical protein